MRFFETKLSGAWLIEPEPIVDERGSFMRTFCARELGERGLETRFVQNSQSENSFKGTLRGMHFQLAPHAEVKLVSCIRGAIYDVIIDLRPSSPSRYKWAGFELTSQNRRQLYIPAGFAHGFQTLTDDTGVSYLISEFYARQASVGVRFDDPAFGIDWPMAPTAMSDKDRNWPLLQDFVHA
ncbi:dTDP-4-dehydrorhamnose 3,5-epimerase [Pseudaminobacter soli (ex Li et al. 2025)]|uniref:dTDP-4-dehydrorhamnose 3,5-epimerase n=1 Tax=Pseudaminobacter soli (ex Li et al. 2025) TaxID=1295366 RepID=A0A2P7S827_9HYPH|nr:dTDP-4-dehydrorhamnose 3,5-epimerase [Mesorhizobium soli]PSJ58643.1 dTDP-4-dehydrorhamnose 3,5-epimerase [Mesorhizobium soli]